MLKYFISQILLLLTLIAFFSQCHSDVKLEHSQEVESKTNDNVEVSSFSIERENSPALANWRVFEDENEIIAVPDGWIHRVKDQSLIIAPLNSLYGNEKLVFERIAKDNPDFDYEKVGQRLAELAFKDFTIANGDTIKKIKFRQNFCFERNVSLSKNGENYTGYFLAYINDSTIYKYNLVLSSKRLNDYKGSLIKDIVGNLQINKQYLISNKNPLIRIVYTRKL